jgi:hypothetical protein
MNQDSEHGACNRGRWYLILNTQKSRWQYKPESINLIPSLNMDARSKPQKA